MSHLQKLTSTHITQLILYYLKDPNTWDRSATLYYYFYSPPLTDFLSNSPKNLQQDEGVRYLFTLEKKWRTDTSINYNTIKKQVQEYLDDYFITIYCDGGFRGAKLGAWAFYVLNSEAMFSGVVATTKDSHQTEFYALKQVFDYLLKQNNNKYYFIFSDSISLVEKFNSVLSVPRRKLMDYLKSTYPNDKVFTELIRQIKDLQFELAWCSNRDPNHSLCDERCDDLLPGKRKKKRTFSEL